MLSTDLGRAVIANAATQILLRQAPQAITMVAAEFRLSAGERALLLAARRGEGLLPPARRPGWRSRPWPRPPSTFCAPVTQPRSPASTPGSRRGLPAWPAPAGEAGEDDLLP